jgi:hypothetical protein
MHFRLPKPLHGWREFTGEVGIIVIGVLIALGAEQVVESVHIRHESEKAMTAVRDEMAHSGGVFDERVTVQPCLDKRLAELDSIVGGARRTGRIPDIGEIGRPPMRPIQSAAWATALTNGTAMHFPDQQRDQLSLIYSQAASYYGDGVDEQMMWATLRVLEHSPGPIDSNLLAEAATNLARLHFRDMLNGIDASQLLDDIRGQDLKPDYVVFSDPGRPGTRQRMLDVTRNRSICQPLVVDGMPLSGEQAVH